MKYGAVIGAGATGLALLSTVALADEAEHGLESPEYPWPHGGFFRSVNLTVVSPHPAASMPAQTTYPNNPTT